MEGRALQTERNEEALAHPKGSFGRAVSASEFRLIAVGESRQRRHCGVGHDRTFGFFLLGLVCGAVRLGARRTERADCETTEVRGSAPLFDVGGAGGSVLLDEALAAGVESLEPVLEVALGSCDELAMVVFFGIRADYLKAEWVPS